MLIADVSTVTWRSAAAVAEDRSRALRFCTTRRGRATTSRSRRTLYGKTDRCCATEADSPQADWTDTAEPDSGPAPARLGDQTGHRCRVVAS